MTRIKRTPFMRAASLAPPILARRDRRNMTTRTGCSAAWAILVAAAAWSCTDRPTEVARVPAPQFTAVKFWEVTASTRWNERATELLALHPPGNAQAWTSRMLTYLSIAQYRAVLAAERGKVGAMHPSVSAAVNGASVAVLSKFFPLDVATIQGWLDDDHSAELWPGEENKDAAAGEAIGSDVGAAVWAQAVTDNYLVLSPGVPPVGDGYWVSAPGTAIVRSLYGVRPFFMATSDQLRPAPPPAFGSQAFIDALHEIRAISDTRTPEQTATALFYAWQTAPFTAGNLNLMADQLIVDYHRTEREAARILAYANAAAFDAQIACFDAKFAYWFIRPSQADHNITFPAGLSLPNHPSYPSGHSCITSAISTALIDAFPSERERLESFITIVGLSRMYGGLHYRFDVEAGQAIGRGAAALARTGSLE
jgi:membrane-associated phospholipid phosphatase